MSFFGKISRLSEKVEEFLISFGIIVMASVAILNVIGRNVFQNSFSWVEEVTQFSVVLVTFVGTAYAARKGAHIRMSMLSDVLGPRTKKALALTVSLGTALFMFYLTGYGAIYVKNLYAMKKYTLGLQVPVCVIMFWVPVGFAATGMQYLATFWRNLKDRGVYVAPTVRDGETEAGYEV